MKRTAVWLIVTLMSIALIGLASFQVYWINNTIDLNKQTFNENVITALQQVAINLERREAARLASENFMAFIGQGDPGSGNIRFTFREERITSDGKRQVKVKGDTTLLDADFISSLKPRSIDTFILPPPGAPIELSVIEDLDTTFSNEKHRFISRSHMVNVVIEQLTNPNRITDRLKESELDSLLSFVFNAYGIDLEYEFGVWNEATDSLVIGNQNQLDDLQNSELRAALYPSDLIGDMNFLLVNFPSQGTYLFKEIWTTLVASVVFILIVVSCFSYAIYIIFKQKKLSEMKNDFINNMTHELKTPIATVGLAVEALGEKEMRSNESVLLRYLGMIKEENTRLSVQVEKVLQSAILEKETFTIKSESLELHEVIKKAVEKVRINLEDRDGEIIVDLSAKKDKVNGDSHHLTNVIINILDNAIKYSPDKPELSISTYNQVGAMVIEISDKGMGMEADTVKHIFEKFYRAHTGNRHDVKGFGLGLSYVKTIIDKHEGEIVATSELGKGSTFKITLPNG